MNISSNNLKKAVVIVILFASIPLIIYLKSFKGRLIPENPDEWGSLGSYLSGTSGLIFSFFAVVFSLISIYVSATISRKIQKDSEVLIMTQNKPYPYINLIKFPENTSIEIQNMGLGPMIVNDIRIFYGNNTYTNFRDLLYPVLNELDIHDVRITYDTAPDYVIPTQGSKQLLHISIKTPKYNANRNESARILIRTISTVIKDYTISFRYADTFNNWSTYSKTLTFFRNYPNHSG